MNPNKHEQESKKLVFKLFSKPVAVKRCTHPNVVDSVLDKGPVLDVLGLWWLLKGRSSWCQEECKFLRCEEHSRGGASWCQEECKFPRCEEHS